MDLTTDEVTILNLIRRHIGEVDSISRESLIDKTKMADRDIRRTIKALRDKGYIIASNSKVKGYYIPRGKEELETMLRETQSRIKQLIKLEMNITKWINGGPKG